MIYKPDNFIIQELVPPDVYQDRGEKAWQLLDERALRNLQAFRNQLNVPLTVNNWHTCGEDYKGARTASGLRVPKQKYWSRYSQHSFGRAFDFVCEIPAEEIRQALKDGDIVLPHPAALEEFDGMSWVHFDTRQIDGHLWFFQP